jgi:hypothetical protein
LISEFTSCARRSRFSLATPSPIPTPITTLTPGPALPELQSPLLTGQVEVPYGSDAGSRLSRSSPLAHWVRYQGRTVYGEQVPEFVIWYDPVLWEYVQDDGSGRLEQLFSRDISGCRIWLQAGALAPKYLSKVNLAGQEWHMGLIGSYILYYWLTTESGSYGFWVTLPEAYSPTAQSPCQRRAEAVLATLAVVNP